MSGPIQAKNNFIEDIAFKVEQSLLNGPPCNVPGQNWALVCVLGPEGTAQRNVKWIFQILGVFETEEEANQHASRLQGLGYIFVDIHLMPLYKMMPLPPCTKYSRVHYVEEEMQKIMGGYKKQEVYAQTALQDRIANDRVEEAKRIAAREEELKQMKIDDENKRQAELKEAPPMELKEAPPTEFKESPAETKGD